MKDTILSAVYSCFADWSKDEQFCCKAGCATCCSTHVTITALEGLRILKYCQQNGLTGWLGTELTQCPPREAPGLTTNEFVAAIMEGQAEPGSDTHCEGKCFFLQNNRCIIYPVRPFSCRCFASATPCDKDDTATVSDTYLDGSTAVTQIIEHLGQFDSWGYLYDILLQQAYLNNHLEIIELTEQSELLELAEARLLKAKPIPGFVFSEEKNDRIASLLQSIFSTRIDTRTIEQILNGRKAC